VWDAEKQVFEATVTLPLAVHEWVRGGGVCGRVLVLMCVCVCE
jgi:hypothetical protein